VFNSECRCLKDKLYEEGKKRVGSFGFMARRQEAAAVISQPLEWKARD
jgi:hypothetical protein